MKKNRTIQLISAIILFLGFVLCRYILFIAHGMKQWPVVLLMFGCIVLGISALLSRKWVSLFTSLGYSLSFAIGSFLQSDVPDAGGVLSNNLWKIWTLSYLVIILLGIVFELINAKTKKDICKIT